MKLPELKNTEKYQGLYVIDFGASSGVGFTAGEVSEILESEKYSDVKVYKIHRAYSDGRMELKGVPSETFQLEKGMFFFAADRETAENEFKSLTGTAVTESPPCRAKVHLARYDDRRFVTAMIYPAEYDDEISSWLIRNRYQTQGEVTGGLSAVERYYTEKPEVLDSQQLWSDTETKDRTGTELLKDIAEPVQRRPA